MLVHWVVLKGAYPAFLNTQNPVLGLVSHSHRTATNQWLKRHTGSHGGDPGVSEKSNRIYRTEIEKALASSIKTRELDHGVNERFLVVHSRLP